MIVIKSVILAGLEYRVDELGRIHKRKGGGFLKLRPNADGYASIVISPARNCAKYYTVHRIIWEAYNGKIPEGFEIDHIDNDRMNCRLDNLQLLTHAENVEKAWAKVWVLKAPDGCRLEVYNLAKFCREQGLDQKSMSYVMSGKRKQHKGWRKYYE